jgi:methionyl-tRNA synthetase
MYVWVDALTNYLTGVGFPNEASELWPYWPADVHVIGKDILWFHAVIWPCVLMALDLPLPRTVFAHGWWTNEGQKISKSLGNIIDPLAIVERYGLDQVRYFLLREVPFGNDGDFSHQAVVGRVNSELANDLGNLAQRVLSMVARNCGGKTPDYRRDDGSIAALDVAVIGCLASAHELLPRLREAIDQQAFHEALEIIWEVIRKANRSVDSDAPWGLRKTDPRKMEVVLYTLMEVLRHIAILLQPFMPQSCEHLLNQLGVSKDRRAFKNLNAGDTQFDHNSIVPGTPLPKPQGVFPRYVEEAESGAAKA